MTSDMPASPFKIRQRDQYQGDDWWQWSLWLDGPKKDLANVEYVEYTLHPTFPKPVRRSTNRDEKFKLETGGWGTFKIHAVVKCKDGTEIPIDHDLSLHYPDGSETVA